MKIKLHEVDFADCGSTLPRFIVWWFAGWTIGYFVFDFISRFVLTGDISITPVAIRACSIAIFFMLLTSIKISRK